MASSTQLHTPDPSAPPEEYRRAVAASIQDLVAGRRPRDPAMSGASTGRLILEGVVESVHIDRLYQQEKISKASEMEGKEQGREEKRDGRRYRRSVTHNEETRPRRRHGHRSPTDNASDHEHRWRRRHMSAEEQAGNNVDNHLEQEQDQRGQPHPTHHLVSGALHAAESVLGFGPDGTPYSMLPTRGKGVGWLPHVKAVHRHIRAEQDAGLRSKGLAEKCVDDFLRKRRAARGGEKGKGKEAVVEEVGRSGSRELRKDRGKEPVVKGIGSEGNEAGDGGGSRSRKLRKRRGERRAGSDERALPQSSGSGLSDGRVTRLSHRAEESIQQPALFARGVSSRVQSPGKERRTHQDRGDIVVEEKYAFAGEKGEGSKRQEAPFVPVVRFQSPTPPRKLTSVRLPTPQGSHISHDIDDVIRGSVGGFGSQDAPRAPVAPTQSATPHRQTTPVRCLTPEENHSHHGREDVKASAGEKAAEERTAVENRVEKSKSQVHPGAPIVWTQTPAAPDRMTPIRLPTPASQVTLSLSPAHSYPASHSSLLPMFLLDEESAARPEETHAHLEAPVYEATPHSTNVEALEHAQAVEEMERRQETESDCRTEIPLTAPQPKVALPTGLEAGLVAKAHLVNVTKQDNGGFREGPKHRESPRIEREMKNSSFKPGNEDLIDLRSDRCPSSNSWRSKDAGTRKPIWGQEPGWNFDNSNKHTET